MAARKKKNERKEKPKKKNVVQKRQEENKAKFIAKLREMPIIQVAAAQVGIHRDTYYEWCNTDSQFKKDCHEARVKGTAFVSDMMESLLIKSAKEGKLTAMIFWLKNHHPQYNDKRYHEHHHHVPEEFVLTEERKKMIADAARAWAYRDPDEDERDEDYEVFRDENGELIEQGTQRWLEENERRYQERMSKTKGQIPVNDISQSDGEDREFDVDPVDDVDPSEDSPKKTKRTKTKEVPDVVDKPSLKTGVAKKIKPKLLR